MQISTSTPEQSRTRNRIDLHMADRFIGGSVGRLITHRRELGDDLIESVEKLRINVILSEAKGEGMTDTNRGRAPWR